MDAMGSGKLEQLLAQNDRLREQCNELHAQHAELVKLQKELKTQIASMKYVIIDGSKHYLLEPMPGNPDRLVVTKTLAQEQAADAART